MISYEYDNHFYTLVKKLIRMNKINLRFFKAIISAPILSRSTNSTKMESQVKSNAIDKLYAVKSIAACLPSERKRHKGQAGRIGIIGGSLEYTGAPYYAGISALRAGADLIHIFCESSAAIPIKCYSPELIVHPVLDSSDGLALITPWLDRLHTVVIGPGLGRKEDTFKVVSQLILMLKQRKIPLVIDADGLFLITENLQLLEGFESPVVLTPNAIEYQRLCNKIGGPQIRDSLGKNISILKKGEEDELLSCHEVQWKKKAGGSTRRCGGQGDILSGSIATFLYWTMANKENLNTKADKSAMAASLSCFTACDIVRTCNEKAYKEMGMGALASDMIKYIPESLREFLSSK